MPPYKKVDKKIFRRYLRKSPTPAENALWQFLRNRKLQGRKFRRQHSIGPYILDFYCIEEHLAIELDGPVHDDPWRQNYDTKRTSYLKTKGIEVIRFDNRAVFECSDAVIAEIISHFSEKKK